MGDGNVKFEFRKSPDYRQIYANGAFGGPTAKGEMKFDLFIEYRQGPDAVYHSVTPDGLGPEVRREPDDLPFIRESQVGIVMTIGEAENFARWLLGHVEQAKKRAKT